MIRTIALLWFALATMVTQASAEKMKLAVTTSFHNSGLSDILLPAIKNDTGIEVQLLVVGTGQALKLGQSGDVDAILVHSRAAEEVFVDKGFGMHRTEIMYNDFVLIGPQGDPANLSEASDIKSAFATLEIAKPIFVSRGDDSGTHKKEQALWLAAGFDPDAFGAWYRSVGAGMGKALNSASAMGAHILSDRASWLNFGNKADLAILFQGDPALFNQYAYLPVNPAGKSYIRNDLAQKLEAWLVGDTARDLINGYMINGETLFTFNAK